LRRRIIDHKHPDEAPTTSSSSLKLHHPNRQSKRVVSTQKNPPSTIPEKPDAKNSPLRSLLIQHPMSALLAAYRIVALHLDTRTALAAQVCNLKDLVAGGLEAGTRSWAAGREGGDLVFVSFV
jgi:hypothetical protein